MKPRGEKALLATLVRRLAPPRIIEQLAYNAKLNKPSPDWVTSEWDKTVDLVAAAMKQPPPKVPNG